MFLLSHDNVICHVYRVPPQLSVLYIMITYESDSSYEFTLTISSTFQISLRVRVISVLPYVLRDFTIMMIFVIYSIFTFRAFTSCNISAHLHSVLLFSMFSCNEYTSISFCRHVSFCSIQMYLFFHTIPLCSFRLFFLLTCDFLYQFSFQVRFTRRFVLLFHDDLHLIFLVYVYFHAHNFNVLILSLITLISPPSKF